MKSSMKKNERAVMTRKEQKQERRKAILMTALNLFVNQGYYETKIADIAAAVPMCTGLLFHYFESKEELLLELVKMGAGATQFADKMPEVSPEIYFAEFLKRLFEFSQNQPWIFNMFILMGQARRVGMPEEVRKIAFSVNTIEESAKIIQRGQESGGFRQGDPELLSMCFCADVQGIMEELAMRKDMNTPDPEWIMAILKS